MSWFHKDRGGKVSPILKHVRHTTFLGAEIADGQLSRLCYTGHANGMSDKGVVQAIVPGDHMLWRADLAEEDDVGEGHVAAHGNIVVTRVRQGRGHELVGHDLWTGEERWRLPVGRMVTRMGISNDTLIFVTFDHVVHAISIATGADQPRNPVMTDQAAARVIDATQHPMRSFVRGSARTSQDDWSDIYSVASRLEVYERDWAGTDELGIGYGGDVKLVGAGSYEGALTLGEVCILNFNLYI
jgi:PQQ-like domain